MNLSTGVAAIRSAFLDFFGVREHEVGASRPLVPLNDPTLLFTNAGMVPFKNYFTGQDVPPYQRATSSQKCVLPEASIMISTMSAIRRVITHFSKCCNFSFGDYFKEEAIDYAWQLDQRIANSE